MGKLWGIRFIRWRWRFSALLKRVHPFGILKSYLLDRYLEKVQSLHNAMFIITILLQMIIHVHALPYPHIGSLGSSSYCGGSSNVFRRTFLSRPSFSSPSYRGYSSSSSDCSTGGSKIVSNAPSRQVKSPPTLNAVASPPTLDTVVFPSPTPTPFQAPISSPPNQQFLMKNEVIRQPIARETVGVLPPASPSIIDPIPSLATQTSADFKPPSTSAGPFIPPPATVSSFRSSITSAPPLPTSSSSISSAASPSSFSRSTSSTSDSAPSSTSLSYAPLSTSTPSSTIVYTLISEASAPTAKVTAENAISSTSDQDSSAASSKPNSTVNVLIIAVVVVSALIVSIGLYFYYVRNRGNNGESEKQKPSASYWISDSKKAPLSIRFSRSEEDAAFDTVNQLSWEESDVDRSTVLTFTTHELPKPFNIYGSLFSKPTSSIPPVQHPIPKAPSAHSSFTSGFGARESGASFEKEHIVGKVDELAAKKFGGMKPMFDRISHLKKGVAGSFFGSSSSSSSVGSLSKFV